MKAVKLLVAVLTLSMMSCGGASSGNSPEKATESYVSMIAKGAYDKAMEISTGPAAETVAQMKETGAGGYETKVIEVQCDTDEETETATCKCTERKIDSTATLNYKYDSFVYELEKLDGIWKVSSQTKDMPQMPGMDEMGFGEEDMMDDAPTEAVTEEDAAGEQE